MATFRKRGKYWEYRVKYTDSAGKQLVASHGGYRLKSSAQDAAEAVEDDLKRGGDPSKQDVLLLDYWDQWAEAYRTNGKSINTVYRYKLFRKHLKSRFDGRKLNSIRPIEWQKFINDFAAGKDRKEKTTRKRPRERSKDIVTKMNSYVRGMVKAAINERILFSDFTFGTKTSGVRSSGKVKVLDSRDFAKVKAIAIDRASYRNIGALAVYIGSMTGMRVSEVLALTWPDIDTKLGVIHVTRSWDHLYGTGFKPTKTDSSVRDIEISPSVIEILNKIHQQQAASYLRTGYRDEDQMIMRDPRHNVITDSACNKALHVIQSKAGIPEDKQITFHGLRHSHVSYLISKGVDIYYISKRLGHSDVTITMKVYGHLLDSQRKQEAQKATLLMDEL
ncbi:site-specific integrase [Lacticaseibacillus chiayiensis]|uniref:site-specific integrase n=1 Tax=Lacticaseibacillus chiayiensis TaxID=2100821 RepID=UPI001BCBE6F0|nr:site-specific integrase [Lacticaseibacillus chiayiensis]QVI35131.1 site-specific integrase [Lacticaseibacillus chiayiensis]